MCLIHKHQKKMRIETQIYRKWKNIAYPLLHFKSKNYEKIYLLSRLRLSTLILIFLLKFK